MAKEISLIPKEHKKEGILAIIVSRLGILAIISVILSLSVYGGLNFYKKGLQDDLVSLKNQARELNQQRDKNFEEEVKSLDQTLKDLKIILKNHIFWSKLFSLIEELAVPQVAFSEFSGSLAKDGPLIKVLGETSGYTYLAKQIRSLEQHALISAPKVGNISLSTKGGIEFELIINFAKDILKK